MNDYERDYQDAREAAYGSTLGLGEVFAYDCLAEKEAFRVAFLDVLNKKPGAVDRLLDLYDAEVECFAQNKADSAQFNPPLPKGSLTGRDIAALAFPMNLGPKP